MIGDWVTYKIVTVQVALARLQHVAASRAITSRAMRGQGMVEYALILAFIAILVIVALKFLQPAVSRTLNNVGNSL